MKINCIKYDEKLKSALCSMIYKLYAEDPEGEPMSQEKIDMTIEQAKAYPDRLRIYIIENEECEIIGYAIIQLIWSNEWGGLTANIDEMYIVESARGQGVGSGFIKAVSKLIPDVNRVTLEVTPSNRKALELYEKLGFRLAENKCMEKTLL